MDIVLERRRGLRLLGASYALAWFTVALVAGPGSAALVALSGRLGDAGLFLALYFLGAAAGGALGGRLMDVWGRRPVLVAGYVTAAIGFALAGAGVRAASLVLFVAGTVTLAQGIGAIYLTRLAAAELFASHEQGRGMGAVQVSAILGAIAGPLLLLVIEPAGALLGRDPRVLIWWIAPPLLLAAALLVSRAPEPRDVAAAIADEERARPVRVAPRYAGGERRALLTGGTTVAFAQASMVMAMGVTGAAVIELGHDLFALGGVMTAHFTGMFALSRTVGRAADRYGRRLTVLAGLSLIAVGGLVLVAQRSLPGLALALFLVGLGWSFAYIAGSLLASEAAVAARRASVLGRVDLVTAVLTAGASVVGGWWYASRGLSGLGIMAAVLVVVPFLLALALASDRPVTGHPVPAEPRSE